MQTMGLAPVVLGMQQLMSEKDPAPHQSTFAERFVIDSAKAGAERELMEKRNLAMRLYATKDWDGALDAFHEWAEISVEMADQSNEGRAVFGMADCLSQKEEVDDKLIVGMYGHVMKCAETVADRELLFHAIAGIATLKRSLRKVSEAEESWQKALEIALVDANAKQASYVYTQLAFLLLDNSEDSTSEMEMVNEDKDMVHLASDSNDVSVRSGASPKMKRALSFLQEAHSALSQAVHEPIEAATAYMNLGVGYLKIGGTANKRKAAQQMIRAFVEVRDHPEAKNSATSIARKILDFHEENPWLEDGNVDAAAVLEQCRKRVAHADGNRPPLDTLGVSASREERIELERARWAQEKLAALRASQEENSDAEDDSQALARPKFDGWQRE
mmetsp:Transcript_38896/g.60611  ORF Transcript_38896/g.60611 Transcript_38896/m.60611 type:complete len:388 (-) Transcript_38896:114-1277(-)